MLTRHSRPSYHDLSAIGIGTRLVEAGSHYDLQRARNLEFPVVRYGDEFTRYTPYTRQPMEIAEAGAEDGAVLAECAYFGDRDRRMIRREQSRHSG